MDVYFGLRKARKHPRPAATIGVFDGVHLGHRKVLDETVRLAAETGGTSLVVTFDRHPAEVVGRRPPGMLTSLEHRLHLLEKEGIGACLVLHFDRRLAAMEAEEFTCEILVGVLGTEHLVLGYNCRIGRGARGDAELLSRLGEEHGFDVHTVGPREIDGAPVSSTRIRKLVVAGRLSRAARLLGRRFSLRGSVVHGSKRGAGLGFPTANLNLHHEVTPPSGVYISRVRLDGGAGEPAAPEEPGKSYWGLTNVGCRPTFSPGRGRPAAGECVEVYIEGLETGPLYGRTLEVEIVRFLRPEVRFHSRDALVAQMEKDRRLLLNYCARSRGGG